MASLPDSFRMGLKPSPPDVSSKMIQFSAQNAAYTGDATTAIRIDLPSLRSSWLDPLQSYLQFTVYNDSTYTGDDADAGKLAAQLRFDDSAACIIQRLEVYSAGQGALLETVSGYSQLSTLLFDLTGSPQAQQTSWGITAGMSRDVTTDFGNAENNYNRKGVYLDQGSNKTFCIPLISILGQNSTKCLPATTGFTLIITLNSPSNAFVTAGAIATPQYSVYDVSYNAMIHEFSPDVHNAIMMSTGPTLMIPAVSYRNYTATVAAQTTTQSFQIGARLSSIKTLLAFFRPSTLLNAKLQYTNSNRPTLGLASYQFRIGSTLYPQRPVTSIEVAFLELLKAWHVLYSDVTTRFVKGHYDEPSLDTSTTGELCSFAIGLDMEPVLRGGKSDTAICGLNTLNNVQITLECTFSDADKVVASQFDAYAHYDLVLLFDPATNSVSAQY